MCNILSAVKSDCCYLVVLHWFWVLFDRLDADKLADRRPSLRSNLLYREYIKKVWCSWFQFFVIWNSLIIPLYWFTFYRISNQIRLGTVQHYFVLLLNIWCNSVVEIILSVLSFLQYELQVKTNAIHLELQYFCPFHQNFGNFLLFHLLYYVL